MADEFPAVLGSKQPPKRHPPTAKALRAERRDMKRQLQQARKGKKAAAKYWNNQAKVARAGTRAANQTRKAHQAAIRTGRQHARMLARGQAFQAGISRRQLKAARARLRSARSANVAAKKANTQLRRQIRARFSITQGSSGGVSKSRLKFLKKWGLFKTVVKALQPSGGSRSARNHGFKGSGKGGRTGFAGMR